MKNIHKNGKKNGNGHATPPSVSEVIPVGDMQAPAPKGTVKLSADDIATVNATVAARMTSHTRLGEEEERHHNARAQLLAQLSQANQQTESTIRAMASKHGIKLDGNERWNFDLSSMTFTRIGVASFPREAPQA